MRGPSQIKSITAVHRGRTHARTPRPSQFVLRPWSTPCNLGTPYASPTARETLHPLLDLPRCRTQELGRNGSRPGARSPPPFAGSLRRRKITHSSSACTLHFPPQNRASLTYFRGQRATGASNSSSSTAAGAHRVHVLTTAARGSPAAVEHHHHLRYSPPHPPIPLPSPETRRSLRPTRPPPFSLFCW